MHRVFLLFLCLTLLFAVALSETPQHIVNKYKNYRTICSGLGYKDESCPSKGVIAFQVMLQNRLSNLGKYQTVKFDTVKLNEGSGYDVKTGKFTATEDGVYSFSWNILAYSGKTSHTEIVKDGNIVAYNYADGRIVKSGHYLTSSSTVNIKMKKKEQVWIRAHDKHGQYIHGNFWSYFSGFKL
ncbi:complement C1q tumor necrosis factor-related protein 3-like [Ostrea edulis]|uniref:complement C1q tumor necrosis factor-related protein 3-like n=1 Tax=Ostrea edulis TaxID=37623 RepID=UPI0024AF5C54|nr:complement C1q tumor necrosis factor-related protein 3-like [Ostrea edulis]